MTDLINEAHSIILEYNPQLAQCWIDQPSRRVDLARAFGRGFVKNEGDDMPEFCWFVLRMALADQKLRKLAA
jgi:hypothetical protein